VQHFLTRALSRLKAWMRPAVHERMLTAVEERMSAVVEGGIALAPQQTMKSMPLPLRQKREPAKFNHSPNPRRALVVGASDAACSSSGRSVLVPYPDAARAVGHALHELESRAASAMRERAAEGKRPLLIEHEAGPLQ
jgi:hypothetical protein